MSASSPAAPLLKEHMAASLLKAIMQSRLEPGDRVVESRWAREFGVAQASIREAINLLANSGFLVKDSGRSARVVRYSEQDVTKIFQVRGALEGLAAHLVAEARADLSSLETALAGMEDAAARSDMRALIENDLAFHLALVRASGNQYLVENAERLLGPLFAFILLRVLRSGQGPQAWIQDLPRHRRILEVIREGNPSLAAIHTQHTVGGFVVAAYGVWSNLGGAVEAHGARRRPGAQTK